MLSSIWKLIKAPFIIAYYLYKIIFMGIVIVVMYKLIFG
jgi:hypothetical protein